MAAQDCLCPACLSEAISNLTPPVEEHSGLIEQFREKDQPSFLEGEDYYFEGGLIVFTEGFLSRRGFCCQSGCRHCPYGFM